MLSERATCHWPRWELCSGEEEARHAFQNVAHVLEASGFTLQDMVFVDIAFIDLADLPQVIALFAELFPAGHRPARTIYQTGRLPYNARIKVAGTAMRAAAGRVPAGRGLNNCPEWAAAAAQRTSCVKLRSELVPLMQRRSGPERHDTCP
ncbi:RidA family protein [Pseudoduganella sp. RAF19]|uniref:RidA family protein n=1 Tax=Pseudoduganella sp. RAF19 TaxID=3233052 RepID=UPI003F99E859